MHGVDFTRGSEGESADMGRVIDEPCRSLSSSSEQRGCCASNQLGAREKFPWVFPAEVGCGPVEPEAREVSRILEGYEEGHLRVGLCCWGFRGHEFGENLESELLVTATRPGRSWPRRFVLRIRFCQECVHLFHVQASPFLL